MKTSFSVFSTFPAWHVLDAGVALGYLACNLCSSRVAELLGHMGMVCCNVSACRTTGFGGLVQVMAGFPVISVGTGATLKRMSVTTA